MSLKECYDKMGADYEDVLSRLRSEVLVRKFALKFLDDDSYANLKAAMESGNAPEAFRGAHTLKTVNLDPRSGWLVTSMVPSQRLRIFFTNVSPRPLPSMLRLPSAW